MKGLSGEYAGIIQGIEQNAELMDDARWLPEDAICMNKKCLLIIRNNPRTERVLALRRLKYWDIERGKEVFPMGMIPYCNCAAPQPGVG